MKLKEIKTEKEFWELADNRYKRTHKLRVIWQNPNEHKEKRDKAYKLWLKMLHKTMILMPIITTMYTSYNKKFQSGGIIGNKPY